MSVIAGSPAESTSMFSWFALNLSTVSALSTVIQVLPPSSLNGQPVEIGGEDTQFPRRPGRPEFEHNVSGKELKRAQ